MCDQSTDHIQIETKATQKVKSKTRILPAFLLNIKSSKQFNKIYAYVKKRKKHALRAEKPNIAMHADCEKSI